MLMDKHIKIYFLLVIAVLILTACQAEPQEITPTFPVNTDIATSTIEAKPTETPNPTETQAPTQTPQSLFSQEEVIQFTPVITTSGTITETGECSKLTWIEDVTIPDGSVLSPGEIFTKIWRVQNSGICDWILGYEVAYDRGEQLDGPEITLAHFYPSDPGLDAEVDSEGWLQEMDIVQPGETVDIPLVLRAPETAGEYQSVWRFGDQYGIGIDFLWIEIVVEENLIDEGSWNGIWYHSDPGTPYISEEEILVVEHIERDIRGYFYAIDGRMMIINGTVSEDDQTVSGTYASPGQPELEFTWVRQGSNFQGKYILGQFGEGDWCGSRDEFTFPNPCGLE